MIVAIVGLAVGCGVWLMDWIFALLCTPFLLWIQHKEGDGDEN